MSVRQQSHKITITVSDCMHISHCLPLLTNGILGFSNDFLLSTPWQLVYENYYSKSYEHVNSKTYFKTIHLLVINVESVNNMLSTLVS